MFKHLLETRRCQRRHFCHVFRRAVDRRLQGRSLRLSRDPDDELSCRVGGHRLDLRDDLCAETDLIMRECERRLRTRT